MRLLHSIFPIRRKILEAEGLFLQANHEQHYSTLSQLFQSRDREAAIQHKKRAETGPFHAEKQINIVQIESQSNSTGNADTEPSTASFLTGRCNNHRISEKFDELRAEMTIMKSLKEGDRANALTLLQNKILLPQNFANILRQCAELHDPMFALKTWNIMVERDIIPNTYCYRSMIETLCANGYLEEAFGFLKYPGEGLPMCSGLSPYNALLRACLKKHDWSFAHQSLELMEENKVGKNEETYTLLLKMAVLNNPALVNKIWEEYSSKFSCSITSLQKFIKAFALMRDVDSAYDKLQRMIELSFSVINEKGVFHSKLDIPIPLQVHRVEGGEASDKFNFSLIENTRKLTDQEAELVRRLKLGFEDVMHACTLAGNFELTERLMLQMKDLGLQPTSQIYHIYLKTLLKEARIDEALEILKMMEESNIQPLNLSYASLSTACSDNSQLDLAEKFIEQFSNPTSPHYLNQFLTACERMNLPEKGLLAFKKMKQENIPPNVRTYELLVSLYLNVNAPYEMGNANSQLECLKRWRAIEMDMARNSIEPNHWLMMYLVKAFAQEGMNNQVGLYLPRALATFRLIENNNEAVLVYTVVIRALINANERVLAVETFRDMRGNGFKPDGVLCNMLVFLFGLVGSYKSALAFVSLMIRSGYDNSCDAYISLFKFVDLKEAIYLSDKMGTEDSKPSVFVYNELLQKAQNEGNLQTMEHLLTKMKLSKIKPDTSTCAIVFSAYCENKFYNTAFEVLQVMCLRMIGLGESVQSETFIRYADKYVFQENAELETNLLSHFDDDVAFTLLMLRWSAFLGFPICWAPEDSVWASRTSA